MSSSRRTRSIVGLHGLPLAGALISGAAALALGAAACASLTGTSTGVLADLDVISEDQARRTTDRAERLDEYGDKAREVSRRVAESFEDFTPEDEYYIGRAVAADIFTRYEPYDEQEANEYLNYIGQSLALVSDRPKLYEGYRFQILDSDEINAFATPSGLVMVTRGALRLTSTEDCVAAILAHEIGHVEKRHGLKSIRRSRVRGLILTPLSEHSPDVIREQVDQFVGVIDDIAVTLVDNGYSRQEELEADEAAVRILKRAGYDPRALSGVLAAMDEKIEPGSTGFGSTHPSPQARMRDVKGAIDAGYKPKDAPPLRQERYEKALGSI